ncbi:MAG: TonB-dependent receptor plug domain-containing protein, partial [Brevundimonas sp.]
MKINTTRQRLLSGTTIGGAAVIAASLLFSAPVMAQDANDPEATEVEEIVITGSRVARSNFTSESPVTVVTAETITSSGQVGLGEVLRQQLASTPSGGFNQSSNLSGAGAQTVDLRGLGTDRTLNLINGRRVANFADALQNEAADLGFIPLAMVERVEILRDGASAVYGADAVTGVVNIILKNDFEGVDVAGQYGISDQGDYETYSLQAVVGGNFERGNAVFGLEYAFTDMVLQRDRDWAIPTIAGLTATGVTNGSGAHPGGTITFAANGALPARTWCTRPIALGGDELTNVAGTALCPSSAPSSPDALIGRYDYALVQSILNGSENLNAAFYGTYELTDSIEGFIEFQYADREGTSVLDGNPIFAGSGSVAYPGGWVVPADNPYNPFPGQSAQVTQRPTSTVGPRNQYVNANSVRYVVGLRGEIAQFDWELAYINTEVTAQVDTDSTFNLARAIRISDPTLCAADPICTAALQPGSLGALDVYRPANWSESEIAYFRQRAISNSNVGLEGLSGVISGDLFELPAGPLGIAVGVDYREEEVAINPDAVTASGESVANQTFPT